MGLSPVPNSIQSQAPLQREAVPGQNTAHAPSGSSLSPEPLEENGNAGTHHLKASISASERLNGVKRRLLQNPEEKKRGLSGVLHQISPVKKLSHHAMRFLTPEAVEFEVSPGKISRLRARGYSPEVSSSQSLAALSNSNAHSISPVPERGRQVRRVLFAELKEETESGTSTPEHPISPVESWSPDFARSFDKEEAELDFDEKEEMSDSDLFDEERAVTPEQEPPFGTPSTSLVKTPEKVKKLCNLLRKHDFFAGQLYGTSAEIVKEVTIAIQKREFSDTPHKRMSSRVVRKIYGSIAEHLIRENNRVAFHAKAFKLVTEEQPLLRSLANALVAADRSARFKVDELRAPKEVINVEHLTKADCRGFHFCPPGHPLENQLADVKRSDNGVYQGWFPVDPADPSGKKKCSTFFPLRSEEEMIDVVETAVAGEPIAMIGNRYLHSSPTEPYLIEAFKMGAVVKSAFPIFYFSRWTDEGSCHVIVRGEPPVSGKELLNKAKGAVLAYSKPGQDASRPNPIRYTVGEELLIEMAPLLSDLGVNQGIFIQFPQNCFTDLVDPELLAALCREA